MVQLQPKSFRVTQFLRIKNDISHTHEYNVPNLDRLTKISILGANIKN